MNKINVTVISWTEEAKYLCDILRDVYKMEYAAEINHFLWGSDSERNLQIISMGKMLDYYRKGVIQKILIPCLKEASMLSMYIYLLNCGVKSSDILYASYDVVYNIEMNVYEKQQKICLFEDRDELDRIEIYITNRCNLCCANCCMFSGLADKHTKVDYSATERALYKLKNIIKRIIRIDLTGGEPFLNPELAKYCTLIRSIFPDSNIHIQTNGTLVTSMSEELEKTLIKNSICLRVAYYPNLGPNIDDIMEYLNERGIKNEILPEATRFEKLYDLRGTLEPEQAYKHCNKKFKKLAMYENELAVCFVPFALRIAADKFNIQINEKCTLDMFSEDLSNKKIIEALNTPIDCCRYCHNDMADWKLINKNKKRNINNWSV